MTDFRNVTDNASWRNAIRMIALQLKELGITKLDKDDIRKELESISDTLYNDLELELDL